MPESMERNRDGLLETHFDDSERTTLKTAFERGDTNAITRQLSAKGITAEGDKREILEALAGNKPEVTADDLKETISDLEAPKGEGHRGADSHEDDRMTTEERQYLLAQVMRRATGESAIPAMDDWLLKLAILNVANAIRTSGIKVTRAQFRKMVGGAYRGLKGMK
jgi:hypothetical protein